MPTENQNTSATDKVEPALTSVASPPAPRRSGLVAGLVVIVLLCGVDFAALFQGGAYGPSTWLPLLMGVAALALMLAWAGPRLSSGPFQKVLIALVALQAVRTATSIVWATTAANAWEETNRTLFYALVLVLVFSALRWAGPSGLRILAASVTGVTGVVVLVILVLLAVAGDPLSMFAGARLNYPVTYYNGLAAFLMIGFWLALGLANASRCEPKAQAERESSAEGEEELEEVKSRVEYQQKRTGRLSGDRFPRWTQPLLLVLAVVLLETAMLPQSRGALWAFFLVLPFFVILSTHRFRALIDLGIVVLPVVLFWSKINGTYAAIHGGEPVDPAIAETLAAVAYSVAVVLGAWLITWLIESRVGPLRRKVKIWISAGLAVLVILGAAGGTIYADLRTTDGLEDYLGDQWTRMTSDQNTGDVSRNRFAALGLSSRVSQWKVAAEAGAEDLGFGLGAQNFQYYWYQNRTSEFDVTQPHSQPMQLFAELGIPGLFLWLAFVLGALVRAVIVRFRSSARVQQAVVAAMTTAVLSWFIHSSADWLWQLAGVSLPAIMLFGGLIATDMKSSSPTETVRAAATRPRLSLMLRAFAALLAVLTLASAVFPYVSLRYASFAAGAPSLDKMTARARTAAALDPTSVLPFSVRATAHQTAALEAPVGSLERLRQLRLAVAALEEALDREPHSWVLNYQAAEALVAARDAALVAGADYAEELEDQARIYLAKARRLNPLSSQVDTLEQLISAGGEIGLVDTRLVE